MPALEKFMFETTFDVIPEPEPVVEEPLPGEALEDVVEEEEPEEFIPTFSEEEMTAAREQGYSSGKEETLRDTKEMLEKQILECLQNIDKSFTELFSIQTKANDELPGASAGIAVAIARKIVPEMAERNALGEIGKVVETAIDRILTEPRVTITVNSGILQDLSERLADMRKGHEQEGRVAIVGDDDMEISDCLLEWDNGGTERNVQDLWQSTDEIIDKYLKDGTIWDRPENTEEPVADDGAVVEVETDETIETTETSDTPAEDTDETENKD